MTEIEEAYMIATRIVDLGIPPYGHDEGDVILLARQFLEVEQKLHNCESQ